MSYTIINSENLAEARNATMASNDENMIKQAVADLNNTNLHQFGECSDIADKLEKLDGDLKTIIM